MKAEICANGTMIVSAETPMESYALRKWKDECDPGDIMLVEEVKEDE